MASFQQSRDALNPDAGDVRPENYLGWSKAIQQPAAGQGTEALLKGIGTGFTDITKVANFAVEHTAIDEAMAKGTALRDAYAAQLEDARKATAQLPKDASGNVGSSYSTAIAAAGSQSSLLQSDPNAKLPAPIANLKSKIDLLGNARGNNKISETDYKGRVDALLSDLRSRYPGYRPQIDQTMEHATGVAGANSYIQSMLSDINSFIGKKDENIKTDLAFMDRPELVGRIPGWSNLRALVQAGDPAARAAMYNMASGVYQNKGIHDDYIRDLEEASKGISVDASIATSAANVVASNGGSTHLKNLMTGGADNETAMNALSRLERSKDSIPPVAIQNLLETFNQGRGQAILNARKDIYAKGPNGETSLAERIKDETKIEAAVSQAGKWYDLAIDRINNKQYGLAHRTANMAESQKTAAVQAVMGNRELGTALAINKAINEMAGGNDFAATLAKEEIQANLSPKMKDIYGNLRDVLIGQQFMPPGAPDSPKRTGVPITLDKIFEKAQNAGIKDPKSNLGFIDIALRIADPKTPTEIKDTLEKAAFHPANGSMIDRFEMDAYDRRTGNLIPGKYSVFGALTNPKMTATEKAAGEEKWLAYKNWAEVTHKRLLSTDIDELRSYDPDGTSKIKIKYDLENHRFEMEAPIRPAVEGPHITGISEATLARSDKLHAADLERVLGRINRGMSNMANIAKQDNLNVNEYLWKSFGQLGVNPQKIDGTPENLMEAIQKAHQNPADIAKRFKETFGGQ